MLIEQNGKHIIGWLQRFRSAFIQPQQKKWVAAILVIFVKPFIEFTFQVSTKSEINDMFDQCRLTGKLNKSIRRNDHFAINRVENISFNILLEVKRFQPMR